MKKLKRNFKWLLTVLAVLMLAGAVVGLAAGQNNVVTIETAVPQIDSAELQTLPSGDVVVSLGEFPQGGRPGDPLLPYKLVRLVVPPDADLKTVRVELLTGNWQQLPGQYEIAPAPPAATWEGKNLIIYWGTKDESLIIDGRDSTIYSEDAYFPSEPVEIASVGQFRQQKIVEYKVWLAAYNPVQKKVRVLSDATAELSVQISAAILSEGAPGLVPADYVIITTNTIVGSSTKLASFVADKAQVYTVKVVTEAAAADDTHYVTGVTADGRADNIRDWLQNHYLGDGTEYVLLIGDPHPSNFSSTTSVPMKMCYPMGPGGTATPSDMFFAELSGNWDLDGDTFYGEYPDDYGAGGADKHCELKVGRIPFYGSYADLDSILQKSIDYGNPTGDQSWRKKALIGAAISNFEQDDNCNGTIDTQPQTFGCDWGDAIKANASLSGFSPYTLYEKTGVYADGSAYCLNPCDAPLNNANLIGEWQNYYGFTTWWAHGSSTSASRFCWTSDGTWPGMCNVTYGACTETSWYTLISTADCISLNDSYPSFVAQISCTNAYPENSGNLGYSLLKQGAIATISGTRVTWYAVGSWNTGLGASYGDNASYGYYYFDRMGANSETAGTALNYCRSNFGTAWGGASWMNMVEFSIYGDPSLSLAAAGVQPNLKWEQPPDETEDGMDIRCDRNDGTNRVLADDFNCATTGPITSVTLWGSWKYDEMGTIDVIHLSIHDDDPCGPGGSDPDNEYSKPDELLWSRDFYPSDINVTLYTTLSGHEWWWDPATFQDPIWPGDQQIWQYEITIDDSNQFIQQGDPCDPNIYWLDVWVESDFGEFGWKTSWKHWNDDAVWSNDDGNNWNELRYPYDHPYYPNSIDLAFKIVTGEEPNVPEVKPPVEHLKWSQPPIEIDPTSAVPTYKGWDEPSYLLTAAPSCDQILYAPTEDDTPAFRTALSAACGDATVDYFDARASTPSVALLLTYDCVFTWVNYAYADDVNFGNNLADYVDAGGKVILGQWCYQSDQGNWLAGRIMTSAYCPVTVSTSYSSGSYAGDGTDCVHNGVVAYDTQYLDVAALGAGNSSDGTFTPGGELSVAWRPDRQVYYSPGNTGTDHGTGDWPQLTCNECCCAAGGSSMTAVQVRQIRQEAMSASVNIPAGVQKANSGDERPVTFKGHVLTIGAATAGTTVSEIRAAAMSAPVNIRTGLQKALTGEEGPVVFKGHDLTIDPEPSQCASILFVFSNPDDAAYRAAISAACGGCTVDYFNASVATPSLALLSTYDCAYVQTNLVFYDNVTLGDNLADYVDADGKVVLGVGCTYPPFNVAGRIMTVGYCPVYNPTANNHYTYDDYAGDGTTCIHNGVSAYGALIRDYLVLQGSGIQDGSYLDGEIAHAYRPDFRVIYSNGSGFFPDATGDWPQLVCNSCCCAGSLGKIVADDFRCLGNMPISSIHWWGSYVGWDGPVPPPEQPVAWRIGFWSNVPPAGGQSSPAANVGAGLEEISVSNKAPLSASAGSSAKPSSSPPVRRTVATKTAHPLQAALEKPSGRASSAVGVEPLGGGDTCATATPIAALPFSDTGNTCGFADDYDPTCASPGSPDVVYEYTPGSDTTVDISLCGSVYDTVLYVYENDCSPPEIACNDDYCGLQSELSGVSLTGGNTYYIIVDGYGSYCGDYIIDVTAVPPPNCPPDTLFGQPVHGPGDPWAGITSDANSGYLVYENFWGVNGEICDIHWWGLNRYFDPASGWSECLRDPPDMFEIKFYEDAAGSPGAVVCTYIVTPQKTDTGLDYSGRHLYEYSTNLVPCCGLTDGWVSIQGLQDPYDCWFLWMSSGTGDGFSYQWDGVDLVQKTEDLSLCLTGEEPRAFSYPETLLWQIEVPADRVESQWVGYDQFPERPSDTCFQYYVQLDPEEWFWQSEFLDDTQDEIFWLSIAAVYENTPFDNVWGWKTRAWSWMDDAVTFDVYEDPVPGFTNTEPNLITPIEDPIYGESFDVAFELDTDPCYIKWEQAFTGIRHWSHYEDELSMATEDDLGEPNITRLVADDWLCERSTPVTAAAWWGSYIGYGYEACQGPPTVKPEQPDYFLLSIWTDVPAGGDASGDGAEAMSNAKIAQIRQQAMSASVSVPAGVQKTNMGEELPVIFTGHVLSTSEAPSGPCANILYCPSDGDDAAYRAAISAACGGCTVDYYDARAGTPSVALLSTYDCVYTWANAAYANNVAFGDNLADYVDAGGTVVLGVFCTFTQGNYLAGKIMTSAYCPVTSPTGGNHYSVSAYAGDGTTCIHNGVTFYDSWARDYLALQGSGIQDGSYLDGEIAQAYRPDFKVIYNNGHGSTVGMAIPGTGQWPDIVCNSCSCGLSFSHPGEKIWEYRAYDYDEVLVGYDKHPEGEPNEPVFRYSVRLPREAWFFQDEPNNVYWFGVVAVYEESLPNYDWGWTNHKHVYNDDAVAGYLDASGEWTWEELYDQNDVSEDMSFILFTDPDPTICTCWELFHCPGQPVGDATCDGNVNIMDVLKVKQSWGKSFGQVGFNACADFDHSCSVNIMDILKVKQNWGASGLGGDFTTTPPATCP